MKTKLLVLFVAVWVPLALGHHSTSMFNMGTPATMEGTVKAFDWMNPHSLLHLDVPNSEGKPEEWLVEIHSIAIMVRRGYTKDYFKPGEKIRCRRADEGWIAHDAAPARNQGGRDQVLR